MNTQLELDRQELSRRRRKDFIASEFHRQAKFQFDRPFAIESSDWDTFDFLGKVTWRALIHSFKLEITFGRYFLIFRPWKFTLIKIEL